MSKIYEFEIMDVNGAISYRCFDRENLDKAEEELERDFYVEKYELYDVFPPQIYAKREKNAQEYQKELITRLEAGETKILEESIEIIKAGDYGVVIDQENNTIEVFPTLDVNFRREK